MTVITNICGEPPKDFIKIDIASDPNFVFVNDSDFNVKQLFDSEGNTVFVNSYNECQHYVSGGWDFTPAKNAELAMQDSLLYVVVVLLVLTFFKKKIRSYI
jgi:hypothetical protein